MQFKDEWFVDQSMVPKFFENRKVIVFGAGQDGRKFVDDYSSIVDIRGFFDNGVGVGCEDLVDGKYIVKNPRDIRVASNDSVILICSEIYYYEMAYQLIDLGYTPGKHFFIWADLVINEDIERFMEHNKKVWARSKEIKSDNEIITIYREQYHGNEIIQSYYVNALAEKYDAKILGVQERCFRHPMPVKMRLHKSFNVESVIEFSFSDVEKLAIDNIITEIFKNLHTKDDIINIEVNGCKHGHDIYSIFLRLVSPIFDLKKYITEIKAIITECVSISVFWDNYFSKHSVKAVALYDALYYQAIIREVALKHDVAVYSLEFEKCIRCFKGYYVGTRYGKNYRTEFFKLPLDKQVEGIKWAREKLRDRLRGDVSDIPYMRGMSPYAERSNDALLKKSDKIKVVICPHCFTDDPFPFGRFLFKDQYEWLDYLGQLSLETDYDWYFKIHPASELLSRSVYKRILNKYPGIHELPIKSSAVQLKKDGLDFALTLWGTLGHEYAALGINVINGAHNPHDDFEFNYTPKTFEEYDELLHHLNSAAKHIDEMEILRFYCMYYKYMIPVPMQHKSVFFGAGRELLKSFDESYSWVYNKFGMPSAVLEVSSTSRLYGKFLNIWDMDKHKSIMEYVCKSIDEADNLYYETYANN